MPRQDRLARIAWQRQHYQKNKVEIAIKAKAYRARNKEQIRAAKKLYRENNREKVYIKNARWAAANPGLMREYRKRSYRRNLSASRDGSYNRNLAKQYGLTRPQYDAMVAAQNGVCAICGKPPTGRVLDVDHDHATGRIRGLLCRKCNVLTGYLETSAGLLGKVSDYLRKL